MKKFAVTILILCLVFALSGCGTGPSEAVTELFDGIKSQDTAKIAASYSGGHFDGFDSDDIGQTQFSAENQARLEELLLGFDYSLVNQVIDGDKATVDVTITAYSLGQSFTAAFSEVMSQIFGLAFSDMSEDELDNYLENIIMEKFNGAEKNYVKTVTINLTKIDGKWLIDSLEDNAPLMDALSGGMVSAVESLSSFDN